MLCFTCVACQHVLVRYTLTFFKFYFFQYLLCILKIICLFIGKNSRNDVRFIPAKILKEIKKNYCKNIDRANQLDNDLEKPQIQNRKKSYFGKSKCKNIDFHL